MYLFSVSVLQSLSCIPCPKERKEKCPKVIILVDIRYIYIAPITKIQYTKISLTLPAGLQVWSHQGRM